MTYVDRDCSTSNGGARPDGSAGEDSSLSLELHTTASTVVIATIRTVAADLAGRVDRSPAGQHRGVRAHLGAALHARVAADRHHARTVAADLAARADFDLDSIDDLRMAVDDLCAMLVRIAPKDATLRCRFTARPERIEVAADVDVEDGTEPPPTRSFSWRVLECLADDVSAAALPKELGQRSRIC
ncbi:MAG: hypothetical protein M3325_08500, partial [Actinomycetota bacterium]|nr:hypothetical protein [Actinomycetota bacterium]